MHTQTHYTSPLRGVQLTKDVAGHDVKAHDPLVGQVFLFRDKLCKLKSFHIALVTPPLRQDKVQLLLEHRSQRRVGPVLVDSILFHQRAVVGTEPSCLVLTQIIMYALASWVPWGPNWLDTMRVRRGSIGMNSHLLERFVLARGSLQTRDVCWHIGTR